MNQDSQAEVSDLFDFDKLWDYNNPADTEKKFKEILPSINESGNISAYLQLCTQIARTLGLQMKFDEAHNILDEVKSQLTDDLYVAQIRYYLERGRAFNSSQKIDKAKELFLKAYELALKKGEDFYAVDAAHMMGIAEPGDKSLKWNETAMKLAEKSADKKANGWLGSLYNNTGWTYHDMKNYGKALELFEKNVTWHTERKTGKGLMIAKWCVGRTLRSLNKIDEALKIQQDLLKEAEEKGINDNGYTYEELGELFLIKKNKDEAANNFGLAYDLLSKDIWLREFEKDRLERIRKLSQS